MPNSVQKNKMKSYIHKLYIHHNFVKRHFEIDLSHKDEKEFNNLMLTGKNGTGKSTLLRAICNELFLYKSGLIPNNNYFLLKNNFSKSDLITELNKLEYRNPKVEIEFGEDSDYLNEDLLVIYIPTQRLNSFEKGDKNKNLNLGQVLNAQNKYVQSLKSKNSIIANLKRSISAQEDSVAKNKIKADGIKSKIKELKKTDAKTELVKLNKQLENTRTQIANANKNLIGYNNQLNNLYNDNVTVNPNTSLAKHLLQFLLDQKQNQAYAIADDEEKLVKKYTKFFKELEDLFKTLYEDKDLKLKHKLSESTFFFEFKNNVVADFNQVADGYKSVLAIVAEILLQKEAFKQENKIFDEEPSGIVIIDEIEAHLHMSVQEKIYPSLQKMFPNLQFLIATHSPQVCASNRGAFVYDLSTNHIEKEFLGGISYDVLSKAHFGLKSEYSVEMTILLDKAKKLMSKEGINEQEVKKLNALKDEIEQYSPELAYELILFLNKILQK